MRKNLKGANRIITSSIIEIQKAKGSLFLLYFLKNK